MPQKGLMKSTWLGLKRQNAGLKKGSASIFLTLTRLGPMQRCAVL
jgi:hypothetical protein